MQPLSFKMRLYGAMLNYSRKGSLQRHCAYVAAGWSSLILGRPTLTSAQGASFGAILGGGALVVGTLVLLTGPLLNALQPAMRAAGRAPAGTWPLFCILALFSWRYAAGRRLLKALAAHSADH